MTGSSNKRNALASVRALPRPAKILIFGLALNRMGNFVPIFLVLYLSQALGLPLSSASLALSVYGVGSVLGIFLGGALVARCGAARVITWSTTISGVLISLIPVISDRSWFLLLVLVCLAGIVGQVYRPAALALLAEVTARDDLIVASAAMRIGLNTGASLGPLIGGVVSSVSYSAVFYVNGIVAFAFALVSFLGLDSGSSTPTQAESVNSHAGRGGYRAVLRDWRFVLVVLGALLVGIIEVQYQSVLPIVIVGRGYSEVVYTAIVSLNALLIILIELPLTGKLSSWGPHVTMSVGSMVIGIGFALYGLNLGLGMLVLATVVWTVGEAVSAPPVSAYPALSAPINLRSHYIGLMATAQSIGYAVGPGIGAALYSIGASVVWWACLVAGLISGLLFWGGSRARLNAN